MKQLVDISKLGLNTVNEQIRNFAQISITGARCAPLQRCEKSNRVPVGARIARPRFVQNLLFAQLLFFQKNFKTPLTNRFSRGILHHIKALTH